MSLSDTGHILFPSITVCKDEMYTSREEGALFTRLDSGHLRVEQAGEWFKARTFSRGELVKYLSINTVEGSNNYPCNTISGRRKGEACSFPFIFPDCKQRKKTTFMCRDPAVVPLVYHSCATVGEPRLSLSLDFKQAQDVPRCVSRNSIQ